MSDQLFLDLDGYLVTSAPATNTGSNSSGQTSATPTTTSSNTNNSGGTVASGQVLSWNISKSAWIPYSIITGGNTNVVSGTLPPPLPTVVGIDYDTKPVVPKEKNKDGCTCKKCGEFYPYAESNQDDGTLICYGCKIWA